jgi:hypothetical protein
MANEKHLEILKKDVEPWNPWRTENPTIIPNLMEAAPSRANLTILFAWRLQGVRGSEFDGAWTAWRRGAGLVGIEIVVFRFEHY